MRYDEPRLVWTSLITTHFFVRRLLLQVPVTKLFAWGEGESGGHVLRETTSRGLCGLVSPSRTSELGGEGDCVKEGEGEEGERERERALGCDYATALDFEVDPQRRRFGRRESDFAL